MHCGRWAPGLLIFPSTGAGLNPIADLLAYRQFAACVREIRPDVALLITIKPIVFGVHAARQAGLRQGFCDVERRLGYAFGQPNWF